MARKMSHAPSNLRASVELSLFVACLLLLAVVHWNVASLPESSYRGVVGSWTL